MAEPNLERGLNQADSPTADDEEARLAALGALAGGAAHDVNNVLGVILGYVELARMALGDERPDVLRRLDLALASVERVRMLTDGILAVAHARTFEGEALEPAGPLREAVAILARTLGAGVTIDLQAPEDLPAVALTPAGLWQLVTALAVEAAQALPGGGSIHIHADEVRHDGPDAPGRYLRLRVGHGGASRLAEPPGVTRLLGRYGARLEQRPGESVVLLPAALALRAA
ncbi:MAG: hypothetical protein O2894_05275, partial [Planctomycetota bacterium]|nr:hypothetical protein [Planctomycetota bacterium]